MGTDMGVVPVKPLPFDTTDGEASPGNKTYLLIEINETEHGPIGHLKADRAMAVVSFAGIQVIGRVREIEFNRPARSFDTERHDDRY